MVLKIAFLFAMNFYIFNIFTQALLKNPFMLNELPYICREMSFEISDELVYGAYLVGYASVMAYIKTYMNKVTMHTNVQIV